MSYFSTTPFLRYIGILALVCIVVSLSYTRLFPESIESIDEKGRTSWAELNEELERGRRLGHEDAPETKSTEVVPEESLKADDSSASTGFDYIRLPLRILSALVGIVCLSFGLFLYTDEQGKIQNRLENVWIRINDAQKASISKHTAFVNAVAGILVNCFEFLFGQKLLSLTAIGVSICFATASANLAMSSLRSETASSDDFLLSALFWLTLGVVPALFGQSFYRQIWLGILVFVIWDDFISGYLIFAFFAGAFGILVMVIAGLGIIVGVGLGCLLFYASIMVIRKSLVMISNSKSFWQTAIFPLVNCVPFLLLYGISYAFVVLLPHLSDNATILAMILLFAAWYTNLVFVLTAFLFFLVSAFLLTHKLVWGFVDRPIYALQELGVAKRTKLLGTIGALLLIGAIGGADWLEKVVEKLNPF